MMLRKRYMRLQKEEKNASIRFPLGAYITLTLPDTIDNSCEIDCVHLEENEGGNLYYLYSSRSDSSNCGDSSKGIFVNNAYYNGTGHGFEKMKKYHTQNNYNNTGIFLINGVELSHSNIRKLRINKEFGVGYSRGYYTNVASQTVFRIFSLKIIKNDSILFNLVPHIKDEEAGFIETISDVFYGSSTGTPLEYIEESE